MREITEEDSKEIEERIKKFSKIIQEDLDIMKRWEDTSSIPSITYHKLRAMLFETEQLLISKGVIDK